MSPASQDGSLSAQHDRSLLMLRLVIFCGSVWLLLSWVLVVGLRRPILPSVHTWLPAVRLMLIMAALGLTVIWPMAALTTRTRVPPLRTLRETILLLTLAQLIAWPAGLVTAWSGSRTSLIAATLTGWGLLAGGIMAWGRQGGSIKIRGFVMLLLLMLTTASAGLLLIDNSLAWASGLGPLSSLWTLASGGLDEPSRGDWWILVGVLVLALLSWGPAFQSRRCACQPGPFTRGLSS